MNWNKAYYDRKIRERGYEPVDELGPSLPIEKAATSKTSSAAVGRVSLKPKKKKLSKEERRNQTRLNYIASVRNALAAGQSPPPAFKKLHPSVKQEISALGPERWLHQQPEIDAGSVKSDKTTPATSRSELLKAKALLDAEIEELSSKMKALGKQYHTLGAQLVKSRKALKALR